MDKKTIIAVAGSAIVTLLVTTIIGSLLGVFARGSDALTEDKIKAVLEETMVTTINGETKTYGEALSLINSKQITLEANQLSMQRALEALSAP